MSETETPRFLRRRPSEATAIPYPTDEATPPVTKINFDIEQTLLTWSLASVPGKPCSYTDACPRGVSTTTCISVGKFVRVTTNLDCALIISIPISRENLSTGLVTSFEPC